MDWTDEYERQMVSPEEAVGVIKAGNRVHFAYGVEPLALGMALLGKSDEFREK